MDNFRKYHQLKLNGRANHDVYQVAKADGMDTAGCVRMLRQVFQLSLSEAKEVMVIAEQLGGSLDDYQEKLADRLEEYLGNTNAEIELTTKNYRVIWTLHHTDDAYFNAHLTLITDEHKFETAIYPLSVADIERIQDYLDNHLQTIEANSLSRSETFTTYELFFQMQALAGDVWRDEIGNWSGDFTLRFLLNVSPDPQNRFYLGGESLIDVEEIRQFQAQVKQLLA